MGLVFPPDPELAWGREGEGPGQQLSSCSSGGGRDATPAAPLEATSLPTLAWNAPLAGKRQCRSLFQRASLGGHTLSLPLTPPG